ncbi:MAG: tetratricopeptide repeat protein [Elainellaceae cyanobacterium]
MNRSAPLTEHNEAAYDELVTLVEASQGTFALFIAACDDRKLRENLIDQYERELFPDISNERLLLNRGEPSLRAAIAEWQEQHAELMRRKRSVVLTVTGAEELLWLNLKAEEADKTELDKFFGYLQWTREAIGQFPYPIVLWVTHRILQTLSLKAPDFWSWRKAVFRFSSEAVFVPGSRETFELDQPVLDNGESDKTGLSLEDLQELITTIEQQQGKEAPALATLYRQIAQAYTNRIRRGKASNLEEEESLVIQYFQNAITLQAQQNDNSAQAKTLNQLGDFYHSQGQFQKAIQYYRTALELAWSIEGVQEAANSLVNLGYTYNKLGQHTQAIDCSQQALEISRQINDRHNEGFSLDTLGNIYRSIGQHNKAIDFHQQAIKVKRQAGSRHSEACSLHNLGNSYRRSGQYSQAIDLYQQALDIFRQTGDRQFEANSLMSIGLVHDSLRQYHRAAEIYRQGIDIKQQVGDRYGEARGWANLGRALAKLDQKFEARNAYENAQNIYQDLGLSADAEQCQEAIYRLGQVIPVESLLKSPQIVDEENETFEERQASSSRRTSRSSIFRSRASAVKFLMWVAVGLGLVIVIFWLSQS